MIMVLKRKKVVFIKVESPRGRVTTIKFKARSTTLKGIQREFLSSPQHFRTEAFPIKIVKKPIKKSRPKRKKDLFGRFNNFSF